MATKEGELLQKNKLADELKQQLEEKVQEGKEKDEKIEHLSSSLEKEQVNRM